LQFTGCTKNDCTLPAKPPHGYFYEISGSNKQICGTMKAGTMKVGDKTSPINCDQPFMCAKGSSGTATATCVKAAAGTAPLQFTGCTKNKCTIPTTTVTGYSTTGLACKSLEATGISVKKHGCEENQGEEDTVKCESPATCAPGYALDTHWEYGCALENKRITAYCKTTGKDLTFSGCRKSGGTECATAADWGKVQKMLEATSLTTADDISLGLSKPCRLCLYNETIATPFCFPAASKGKCTPGDIALLQAMGRFDSNPLDPFDSNPWPKGLTAACLGCIMNGAGIPTRLCAKKRRGTLPITAQCDTATLQIQSQIQSQIEESGFLPDDAACIKCKQAALDAGMATCASAPAPPASHGLLYFFLFLLLIGGLLVGYHFWDTKNGGQGVPGLVQKAKALQGRDKVAPGGGGGIYDTNPGDDTTL
jgi:hypothetical protein